MSDLQKGMIIAHRSHNMSYSLIAKEVGCSRRSRAKFLKRFEETGNTKRKTGSGRPDIFSDSEKQAIITLAKKNRKISARGIIKVLKLNSTTQSVRNVIHSAGG